MSEDGRGSRPVLRLLQGGRDGYRVEGVAIVTAPEDRAPFLIDARVIEDDTYLVLGADPAFHVPAEHPVRIWQQLRDVQPASPGSVVSRGGRPLELRAVVHDLSLDPSWKEEWIAQALEGVFRHVAASGSGHLGLPLLGKVHGRLPVERFFLLLLDALVRHRPARLQRIWLIATPKEGDELARLLESTAGQGQVS